MNQPFDGFSSVDHFLREVSDAKTLKRQAVANNTDPLLDDSATFAMAPAVVKMLDKALEDFGDEVYKQWVVVCLGKWADLHQQWLLRHIQSQMSEAAAMTAIDMNKINQAIRLIDDVGSFSGNDDYRAAMKQQINQAILEYLEDTGRDPEKVFQESPFDDPLL